MQGKGGGKSRLLEEFKVTPNAVLFATASFWQSVDVKGEALSAVIIDKLPFQAPSDHLSPPAPRRSIVKAGTLLRIPGAQRSAASEAGLRKIDPLDNRSRHSRRSRSSAQH